MYCFRGRMKNLEFHNILTTLITTIFIISIAILPQHWLLSTKQTRLRTGSGDTLLFCTEFVRLFYSFFRCSVKFKWSLDPYITNVYWLFRLSHLDRSDFNFVTGTQLFLFTLYISRMNLYQYLHVVIVRFNYQKLLDPVYCNCDRSGRLIRYFPPSDISFIRRHFYAGHYYATFHSFRLNGRAERIDCC